MSLENQRKYAVHGNKVHPFFQQKGSVVDHVPVGYYIVKQSIFGYYLEKQADAVQLPKRIYGSTQQRADRIWSVFNRKDGAMSVGLFGSKGAGKTLLANVIAQMGLERDMPVIDVGTSFSTSSDYLDFVNNLGSCVIIFDEFLKKLSKMGDTESSSSGSSHRDEYERRKVAQDRQDEMLTFFQGSQNSKRLVMLIDNSSHMLSEFFRDRPGRMHYSFNYSGVEADVVKQLAADAKLPADKVEMLQTYSRRYGCTFDVINEIITEWLAFPEDDLETITSIMNVPTLLPTYSVKARITECKLNDGYQETTGIAQYSMSDNSVSIAASKPNPFFNQPEMTEDEWENTEFYNDMNHSYRTFKLCRKDPMLDVKLSFHDRDLIGIRGNEYAYDCPANGKIVIELMDVEINRKQMSYFASQDVL